MLSGPDDTQKENLGPFNKYVGKCEQLSGESGISFSTILANNVNDHMFILQNNNIDPCYTSFAAQMVSMYTQLRRAHKHSRTRDFWTCNCGCVHLILNEVANFTEQVLGALNQGHPDNEEWEWDVCEKDDDFLTEFETQISRCARIVVATTNDEDDTTAPTIATTTRQQQQRSQQSRDENKESDSARLPSPRTSKRDRQPFGARQQRRHSSTGSVLWNNPPSLSLITDPDNDPSVFVSDFKQFGTFWKECCENVFFDDIPSKFDLRNIDRVELDEFGDLKVSFYRRPKKILLEEFAEQVTACGLAQVDVCDTFNVTPTPSPRKRTREWIPRDPTTATTTPTFSTKSFANVVSSSRKRHSPSAQHKRQHQDPQFRRRDESSFLFSHKHHSGPHSRRKSKSKQSFETPPLRRTAYKGNLWDSPDRFPRRETLMPGLGGSGMNKLTQLERKIDFVMSFLMKHYGFT